MPWLGLIFELRHAETVPGQELLVTGGAPELGSWDADEVIDRPSGHASGSPLLCTDAPSYPRWSTPAPVWFEFADEEPEAEDGGGSSSSGAAPTAAETDWSVNYKYVKVFFSNGGRSYQWEDAIPNRCVKVPCQPGAIWLISDVTWAGPGLCRMTQIKQPDAPPHHLQSAPGHAPLELETGIVPPAGLPARCLPSTPRAPESAGDEVLCPQEEVSHPGNMLADPGAGWQVNESAMNDVQCLQDVRELKDLAAQIWKGRETQETRSLRGMTEEHQRSRAGQQGGNDEVRSLREVVVLLKDVAAELSRKQGAREREENELWSLRDEVSRLTGSEAELRKAQDAQRRARNENRSLRDEVSRLRGAEAELRRSQDAQKRAEDEIGSLRDEVSRLRGAEAELRRSQDEQKRAEGEIGSLRDEVARLRDAKEELCCENNLLREQLAWGKIRSELNAGEALQKMALPSKEAVEKICERRTSKALGSTADMKSRYAKALEAKGSAPQEARNELMKALEKQREKLAAAGR